MKIDYVISINIEGNYGKSKATKEKINHLVKINEDTNIYSLNQSRLRNKYISIIYLEIAYLLKVIFSKRKPDIIFTRSYFMFGTYLVSKLFKTIVIREIHADFYDESRILFKNSKLKQKMSKLYTKYSNWFNNRSDGLIFNNILLENYFKNNYLSDSVKTKTIHNGTDIGFFIPKDEVRSKKILNLEIEKKYLLFLGSVSKWHGIEYALEMFRYLQKYDSSYHLLIVGGSNNGYLSKIKDQYNNLENITFAGKVNKETAVFYINSSAVCLLPLNDIRISPGSPLKLFDYAACGKAIITQENMVGYSDIVTKYKLGASCNFMNPEKSASFINEFIKLMDSAYYLNNNRLNAVKHFDWEVIMREWVEFAKKCNATKWSISE
jgi:glycosyltransferase involved in cell wall biosynthesis